MVKKILVSLIIFIIFPLFVRVSAQEATPIFIPFCFNSVRCDSAGSNCSGLGENVHRARLTVKPGKEGPEVNSKIYVVDCISTGDGQHCTSGNAAVDTYLSTYINTVSPMPSSLGYNFEGLFMEDGKTPINQTLGHTLMTNASGALLTNEGVPVPAMEWQDSSEELSRKFLGISEFQPEPTIDPSLGLGAQQQREVTKFEFAPALENCVPLVWDPDGAVFDSQSLEPIPGASVTLTKKRTNGIFSFVNKFDPNDVPNGILTNPYLTLESGGFSFFVPDGTYKLTPQITGYHFPSSLTLNPNYSKAYTDIYPLLTGLEIVEKGGPQHRDIPVDSTGGQPTYFPIKIMEYSYQSDRISSVFIDGRVSHPLATINAYSVIPDPNNSEGKIRYKLVKTTQADKAGRFSLKIDQSTFDKTNGEMFGEVEAVKADFGYASTDTNSTPAVLKLNPILTYIEGNASYQGKELPGAKVELVLNPSAKPYYTTIADSQGHFRIPSDYIPFMPYQLRYSSGGVVSTITTSKFIIDNSANIKSDKTDLFYPQYSNPKVNASIKKSAEADNNKLNNNNNDQSKTNQPASKNLIFIATVVFIILLLTAVGVLGVYLIKKSQSTSTM